MKAPKEKNRLGQQRWKHLEKQDEELTFDDYLELMNDTWNTSITNYLDEYENYEDIDGYEWYQWYDFYSWHNEYDD